MFFPRIDTPATRDTQVVSDGATFADREDAATDREVQLVDRRSLVYRQVDTARSGRYRITKTYTTDPARAAVLVDVRFESLTGKPYSVYVLHDVGLGSTPTTTPAVPPRARWSAAMASSPAPRSGAPPTTSRSWCWPPTRTKPSPAASSPPPAGRGRGRTSSGTCPCTSPSGRGTIAAEIAGLVCAADIARRNGQADAAARYLRTADDWQGNLERWTLTRNGPLSPDPYYLRITANGDANSGVEIQIADGGPLVDQRRVVDPSFLEVVRLGVKSATDPGVRSTLPVVDRELRYQTANGPFWQRSSFDGYGEKRDGSQWEPVPPGSGETLGRGWPLLTGERGEYALAASQGAQQFLDTMARSADDHSTLLAEQVWDHRPPADGSDPRFRPVETPSVVACRYRTTLCP